MDAKMSGQKNEEKQDTNILNISTQRFLSVRKEKYIYVSGETWWPPP